MLKKLSKLYWYFKERAVINIIALIILLIVNFITIAGPLVLGAAVDSISTKEITTKLLTTYVLKLSALAVSEYILSCIWSYILFKNARILEYRLSTYLMNKILKMPRTFFEKFGSGDLMNRASSDIEAVGTFSGFGLLALFDALFYLPLILIVMGIRVSWILTLYCTIPLTIVAFMTNYAGKYIYAFFVRQQEAGSNMSAKVLEYINGIRLVRAYVLEESSLKDFEESTKDVYEKTLKAEMLTASFWPVSNVFIAISYAISLICGAGLISSKAITLGDMVTFNIYLSYLIWPMYAIGEFINVAHRGAASTERIYEVLEEEEDEKIHKGRLIKDELNHIRFADYSFKYPQSKEVNLKNINLQISRGRTLGIAGRTGSGKTTLIRQLLQEYPIGSGELSVNQVNIENLLKPEFMKKIAYVSQDNILFSGSIKDNILFGNEFATEKELKRAINLAGLESDIEGFSDKEDTVIGERGVSLSGGQRQRVAIARALIKDAELLILDDCLSAVDAKTESRIIKNIYEHRQGKTNIITSHRLSVLVNADNIIVLDKGVITEEGTHLQLINKDTWYAKQYRIQELEEEDDD